ncbi:MAG: ABC transporter permease [Synergistaceae bacterium]|jgi:NitT/TauT family transport system permease protein|nr:ABC transporter permease [Synergistaceae bacterium]
MKSFLSILIIAVFFLVWESAARLGLIDTQFIPSFTTVMKEVFSLMRNGSLFVHILASVGRLFSGIVLAVALALPLGFMLAGWTPRLADFLNPLFTNLSMANPFTLVPIFILLLGMGEASKIGIIFWVVLWPALFSTIAGVTQIDPEMIKAARAMGASGTKIFFSVILPGSVNRIFTGVKSSVTFGFTVLVGAEMIGAKAGLDFIVFTSNQNYNIPRLYVGILTIAVVGVIVSRLIERLQKLIVVWEDGAGQAA